MPFMTDGRGADWIGGWFGVRPERGITLMSPSPASSAW